MPLKIKPAYSHSFLSAIFLLLIIIPHSWGGPQDAQASHKIILLIPEVALLRVSDDSLLELSVIASPESQRVARVDDQGARRLFYTAVNAAGSFRTITVQWDSRDAAPSGTSLRVLASFVPPGCGIPSHEIILDDSPQVLIAGIPSCFTGEVGAEVVCRLVIDDPSVVVPGARQTVHLIFTLRDDA